MEIIKKVEDQIVILSLDGNIISGVDANKIHQIVHEELENNYSKFILDLSKVALINSSGVGILISALTAAKNLHGDVYLAAVSDKVNHILKMMRLDQVFQIFDTIENAKSGFDS